MATMMVALCVGVTKTPLGTTLVVTEMAGLPLLPVTLIAAIVALVLSRPGHADRDPAGPAPRARAGREPT